MNIKITKNIKEANLITHSSTFHPDDVFSTVFLSKIVKNPILCRVNNVDDDAPNDSIIYDIGFGTFDHHGPDAKWRNENLKYCSFGLLWQEYGKEYLKTLTEDYEELWRVIDEKLVMQIDAIDNGIFPSINAPYHLTDLDQVIDFFNKAWNEDVDNDDNFMIVLPIAEAIFDRIIIRELAKITASKKIEKLIDTSENNILILDEYMPYQDAIFNSKNPKAKDIKVVIFPSNRGGYSIKPMTLNEHTKELVCHFDSKFFGLHDEELATLSNIKTARFVHSSGFLACTNTLEDAILMANNAINNKE